MGECFDAPKRVGISPFCMTHKDSVPGNHINAFRSIDHIFHADHCAVFQLYKERPQPLRQMAVRDTRKKFESVRVYDCAGQSQSCTLQRCGREANIDLLDSIASCIHRWLASACL